MRLSTPFLFGLALVVAGTYSVLQTGLLMPELVAAPILAAAAYLLGGRTRYAGFLHAVPASLVLLGMYRYGAFLYLVRYATAAAGWLALGAGASLISYGILVKAGSAIAGRINTFHPLTRGKKR